MIIYEKDNKLNINFENTVDGEPDLQISKEDGKTSIAVDGQQGGGGGSSNLVFDLANAKRPEIDGIECNSVYAYNGIKNKEYKNVLVYDFPNGYPPIISDNNALGKTFDMVNTASSPMLMAGQEDDNGALQLILLEDVQAVELVSNRGTVFYIFPTTAKFGFRKITVEASK